MRMLKKNIRPPDDLFVGPQHPNILVNHQFVTVPLNPRPLRINRPRLMHTTNASRPNGAAQNNDLYM